MPRLTHLIHPYYGRLPINADGPCPSCGAHNAPCYLICPCSPASQTYEEERAEALEAEAEIAAVGFMAWDSAQHRRHGLPCPYDGYDPAVNEYPEWEDGDTLTYEAHMDDDNCCRSCSCVSACKHDKPVVPDPESTVTVTPAPLPRPRTCEFDCTNEATVYGGFSGAGDWAGRACDKHAEAPGFTVWDRLVPTTYVPDTGPWPDDLPF